MEVSLDKKLELIGKIDFFSNFDETDRKNMAQIATFKGYEAKEMLIEQNSINLHLIFIINGEVNIVINGKFITTLMGGGHVFGEMSFVHHSPASASVVANTKVVAMLFDTSKINLMYEPQYHKLRMEIYHSCARILAKRLLQANTLAAKN